MCLKGVKFNWPKIIGASILFAIVSQIFHTIGAMASMNFYIDPAYFSLWSPIMMHGNAAPGIEFFAYALAFAFISALIYSCVYSVLRDRVPGSSPAEKGAAYGFLLFLVATIPGSLSMMLILAVPLALNLLWATEALAIFLVGGTIIGKMLK